MKKKHIQKIIYIYIYIYTRNNKTQQMYIVERKKNENKKNEQILDIKETETMRKQGDTNHIYTLN